MAQVLREVVESSSLEILKSGMDVVLDNQLQVAMKRGIGLMTSRGLLMTSASPKLTCFTQADFRKDLLPKKE